MATKYPVLPKSATNLSNLSDTNISTPLDDDVLTYISGQWINQQASGGGNIITWGSITGTLSDQLDLQSALDLKSNTTHNHLEIDIVDLDKYTQSEVDVLISGREPADANIQGHIVDTNNPHSTTLSNLPDTAITSPTQDQTLVYSGGQWINSLPAIPTFIDLTDTPDNYIGATGQYLKVLSTEDGVEYANINAIEVLYDNSAQGLPSVNVQEGIDDLRQVTRYKLTTHSGIIDGGLITAVNGSTTFDISAGKGVVVDQVLNPGDSIGVIVDWLDLIGTPLTMDGSGSGSTFIFLTSTGQVAQFLTKPSKQTFINNMYLGVVYYQTNAITIVFNSPDVVDLTAVDLGDYIDFVSPTLNGITPIAIGAGDPNSILEFFVTEGQVFSLGVNWHVDRYNPNILQYPAIGTDSTGNIPWNAGATWTYILGDGTIFGTNVNVLDETIYDDGTSSPGNIGNGDGDGNIQFIIELPGGGLYVQPYTETYRDWKAANSSVDSALSKLVLADEIAAGVVVGAYIGQEGTDSWERGDRASITTFSSASGSSSSSGGTVAEWGTIIGTLSAQGDLQTALDGKEPADVNIQAHLIDTNNPHSTTLSNLPDTAITTPLDNQTLVYSGGQWINTPPVAAPALNDLTDTIITTPVTDEVLGFDGTNWINQPLAITFDQIEATGTDYPLTLDDGFSLVKVTSASATTVTVQPESAVNFQIGTDILISQYGAGAVTLVPGAGVTINSAGGLLNINGQFATATLIKVNVDEWLLVGSLV